MLNAKTVPYVAMTRWISYLTAELCKKRKTRAESSVSVCKLIQSDCYSALFQVQSRNVNVPGAVTSKRMVSVLLAPS